MFKIFITVFIAFSFVLTSSEAELKTNGDNQNATNENGAAVSSNKSNQNKEQQQEKPTMLRNVPDPNEKIINEPLPELDKNGPKKVLIKKVTIKEIPLRKLDRPWDPDKGPDIYIVIGTKQNNVLFTTRDQPRMDVTSDDIPLVWELNPPFVIDSLLEKHALEIYDKDDGKPTDDVIGFFIFYPFSMIDDVYTICQAKVINNKPYNLQYNKKFYGFDIVFDIDWE